MKFELQRVLVAVDLRECSAAALRLGARMAEKFSATLVVFHAVPSRFPAPLAGSGHVILPARNKTLSSIENDLTAFVRGVIGRKPMPELRIIEGEASEAILFAAGYEKVSLIVLGTRGAGGLARLTLGSVSERVLRLSTLPVLTICQAHSTKRAPSSFRRILCPVNYSAAAGRAIEVAVSIGKHFDAEVIALHVIEKKSFGGDFNAEKERLRVWTRSLIPRPTRPTPLVVAGRGGDQVLAFAKENDIDLLVVAARRERFSDKTVFGTTAERVTRNSPCAVLTVTVTGAANTR